MSEDDQQLARKKTPKKSESLWLMSFSDMSLVMLCFFVLMISTMKPDKDKFQHVQEGLSKEKPLKESKNNKSISEIEKKLKDIIKVKKLEKVAAVDKSSAGLQLEFKDGMMFSPGSAGIKRKSLETVREVMSVISEVQSNYNITIEGHTDDLPFKGSKINNWKLSANRGFTIMQELHKSGIPEGRVSVTAFAHTRPKIPYEGLRGKELAKARASNRRVVIWLE